MQTPTAAPSSTPSKEADIAETAVHDDDPWGWSGPPAVADTDLQPLPPALAEIEAMLDTGEDRLLAPGERHLLPGVAGPPEVAGLADEGYEALPIGFAGWEWALLTPLDHRGAGWRSGSPTA